MKSNLYDFSTGVVVFFCNISNCRTTKYNIPIKIIQNKPNILPTNLSCVMTWIFGLVYIAMLRFNGALL